MSLSIKNLRNQGYDNGRNMRTKNKGVQRRILDVNPRALFIPCCAHTLNFAVNDAVKCCLRVYVIFSVSTRRWEVLTRHVSNLSVKPLSETRWESRIGALKPLRYQLGDIYDALAEIANDTNLTGASVVSLVVWYNVLFEINITSKQLQPKEVDMHGAINYPNKNKEVSYPKEKLKINFYFAILDKAIQLVEERFTLIQTISLLFGFLYDVHSLKSVTSKEVMEHCLNPEKAMQHVSSKDIDAVDLCSELKSISRRIVRCKVSLDLQNFILNNNLTDCVPNTVIVLRILLTLLASVASGERSFSKLKLIKIFLRTFMQQERLAGLATLSTYSEHDIAKNISQTKLVSTFAKTKARKVKF
ncbi:uncharacterized protein LOC136075976 [Hydra vulgaris]|uniref:Uncharacterized protein LOC136075976 n=1 Tax=Hydra vulgaris TaxID=6087 RepID=A0ABM4B9C7_HYDVU